MNERIEQLKQQAREFAITQCSVFGVKLVIDSGEFEKKFAELIIRECAMFIVLELEGKVGSRIADATANRLEEHFGIKE